MDDTTPSRRRSRLRRRRFISALVALVIAWLLFAVYQLAAAVADGRSGERHARAALDQASADPLGTGPAEALRRAGNDFREARDHVRSWAVAPLRALPTLGRQLRAGDDLARTAREATAVAVDALTEARAEVESRGTTGADRVHLLRAVQAVAERAGRRLDAVRLPATHHLIDPLADAYDELTAELDDLRAGLGRGRAGAEALARLLEGGRYLVLAANNAEMRAGSGMFLSAGLLTTNGGQVELSGFRPTLDLMLPPDAVDIEGDLEDRWGWLQPNAEWRNLGLSPRFDVTAPLASRMWVAAGGDPVQGVLAVDPVALRAVLAAIGPVRLGGGELTRDNVTQYLMHDQYEEFSVDDPYQSARREQLGNVATAIVAALDSRQWQPATLGRELADAARGRHILAWSSDPVQQQGWSAAGVDGALGPDSLLVAVLNRGGNKLDHFLGVRAELELAAGPGSTEAVVRLHLRNETPPAEPPYVAGPEASAGLAEGEYGGLVAVSMPRTARNGRIEGQERLAVAGADGPSRVIAAPVRLLAQEERTVVIRFELPPSPGVVRVEPSARVPPVDWSTADRRWKDVESAQISW